MPYLPQSRMYRTFAASNFQSVTAENQEQQEQSWTVRGHYTVFESPYELCPGVFETIARTALDETDMSDVLFQFNHSGAVLARLRNHSLRLGIDEVGGWCEADLSGCQQARDIYEAISNGLIDRMSFGFTIAEDGFEWREDEMGNIHTRITKIEKLFDVSCVDMPASDYTDISARAYVDAAIEAKKKAEELRAAQEAEETPEDPIETTEDSIEEPADEPITAQDELSEEELIEETLNRRSRLKRRARALSLKTIYVQQ